MSAPIFHYELIVVSGNNRERIILYLFARFTVSESWQNQTNVLRLVTEILYTKQKM